MIEHSVNGCVTMSYTRVFIIMAIVSWKTTKTQNRLIEKNRQMQYALCWSGKTTAETHLKPNGVLHK